MVAILGFSKEQIRHAVVDMYTAVANRPRAHFHFPVGETGCKIASYPNELTSDLPESAIESFAGVGCPFRPGSILEGDVVLDVGSGSGTDTLIASKLVGKNGKVWALDTTPAMLDKLNNTLNELGVSNVETIKGDAEEIPLPDNSVDAVTSNGVINLVPDKRKAVAEIFRVLKPGGRVQIADIVICVPVTPDCKDDPKMWAECVVGATVDESYLNLFRDAGFEDVEVLRDYDYFEHSPSDETKKVAKRFGARALEIGMRRADEAPAKIVQFARRANPVRILEDCRRRGIVGMVSLFAAIIACYGTLALVAILSMMGAGIVFNETIWAGSIVFFSILVVVTVALGWRKYESVRPLMPAVLGAGLIIYTMYVNYTHTIEALGFLFLAVAAFWDYLLRRAKRVKSQMSKAEISGLVESPTHDNTVASPVTD